MTKDEMLTALRDSRARLEAALQGLSEAQMMDPGVMGDWSVKDLLAHMTAWEAEAVRILARARAGQSTQPAATSEAEMNALNAKLYKENKNRPLENVLADFHGVHKQLLRQVEALSDADLNRPIAWLGNQNLASIVEGDGYGHEAEHLAHILAWRKAKLGMD